MKISSEFSDLLRALNAENARYLVVGAYALNYYSRPRATNDFDIWVDRDRQNAVRVFRALAAFGVPLDDLTIEDLASADVIFQIGVAPIRIDILTDVSGLTFSEAWVIAATTTWTASPLTLSVVTISSAISELPEGRRTWLISNV